MWGYIAVGLGGVLVGFLFASLFGTKSPEERERDDAEQEEYMKQLYEKNRRGSKDES